MFFQIHKKKKPAGAPMGDGGLDVGYESRACSRRDGLPRASPRSYWNENELPEQAGQQESQRKSQQKRAGVMKGVHPDTILLFLDCTTVLSSKLGSSALEILPRLIHFCLSFVDLGDRRSDLFHARDKKEKTDSDSHNSRDNPRIFQGAPSFRSLIT